MMRIISGSVCAPDRLKHLGHCESDLCSNPDCGGARATIHHLFWDCCIYEPEVRRLRAAIDDYCGKVQWHSRERAQQLKQVLGSEAFRVCGICNAPPSYYDGANKLCDEADDVKTETYQDGPIGTYPDGTQYDHSGRVIVYTDGSASGTASRASARAGWGVFYGPGHPLNRGEYLTGPVQTSARAELRAIMHV